MNFIKEINYMSVELSEQTTENSSIREEVDFKVCEKEITYKEETKVGRMYTFCYRDGVPLIAIGPDCIKTFYYILL